MSDLKNWFNLQHLSVQELTLLESQLLKSYSFGFTLEDSSGKEHPSPSQSFGGATQNFIYCFYKCYGNTPSLSSQ